MDIKQNCKGTVTGKPCPNKATIETGHCADCARKLATALLDRVRRQDAIDEQSAWNRELRKHESPGAVNDDLISQIDKPRCTDTGNALRFGKMWYETVLYVPEADNWWVWNGKVWQEDVGVVEMLRLAKLTIRQLFVDAAKHEDKDLRDAELKWAKNSESQSRLLAMIASAKSVCKTLHYQDFDKDPYLFNAANAAIDLRTGKARPHDRLDYATKLSPVNYDPNAKAPRWEQFLREIFPGHEECCVPFMRRAIGYTMTGCIHEECFFVPYGTGRNGKGKLLNTVQYVMGDYARDASFDTFVAKRGDEKLNDIAGFRGARLILASESECSKRLAEAKIKRMTGGDRVVGEFKYKEQFSYVPSYKIWLVTNYKPRVIGTDDGIWDRMHLILFGEYFGDDRRDPQLEAKLRAEASGILNWCIAAAKEWYVKGLGSSMCIKSATEEYRKDQNVLGQFLEDRCTVASNAWITKGDLYKAYKLWAENMGEFVMTQTEFNDRIANQFEDGRSGPRGRHWKGVTVRREYMLHDEDEQDRVIAAIQ
jgi:putative DNA primase/helicase